MGQWAEFSIRVPGVGEVGGFRFAIIGSEARDRTDLYWFENYLAQGHDERVTQVLVPGFPYDNSEIAAGRTRTGAGEPSDMPHEMLARLQEGGAGNASTPIREVCAAGEDTGWWSVTVPAGAFDALRVRGAPGEMWLSEEVPFGVVKLAAPDGAEVVLTSHGSDATSWMSLAADGAHQVHTH